MECRKDCPLKDYCMTQKHEWESCADMVFRYNAGLLLAPKYINKSAF